MKKAFLAVLISVVSCGSGSAAELFWDGDGVGPQGGGAGQWNTTSVHFSTSSGGAVDQIWNNANVDNATLNGTAGAVTLAGSITVNTITTTIGGYVIGNGNGVGGAANTIVFSGTNAGVNTTQGSGSSQFTALLSGTINKTGNGRMELNNTANPNTNKYVLKAGALTAPAPSRYGTAPGALVPDFLTFDGGGLGANTTTAYDMGTTRGVTVLAGGANFGATATTVVITIGAPIVGSAGGDVTVTSAGPFTGNAHNAGGVLLLSNTSNSWNGNLNISGTSGSAVRAGTSNVIPDTAIVNITVAGNTFDMATNNTTETVKSVMGTAGTIAIGNGSLTVANPNGETYSSVLTSGATGKFIKNGAGTLTLSGSSTGFTGELILNQGKIGVGGSNSLGAGASSIVTINGGTLANTGTGGRTIPATASVNLNADFSVDDSLNVTPGQILFAGPSTIKNSNRTFTVTGATTNLGFSGAMGQDVAGRGIIKEGSGILALNAVNTYSGSTQINAGAVNVDGDGTLGDQTGTLVLNGGRLNTTASRNTTNDPIANPINVTANSELTTTSTAATAQLNLSNNSVQGTSGTTLTIRNDATTGTGAFLPRFTGSGFDLASDIVLATGSQDANRTVTMQSFNSGNTTQTFSGNISGTGSYNRSASSAGTGGTTVFTGANTYSGDTTINDGTLVANNTTGGATGTGAVTINNGGTLAGSGAVAGNVTAGGKVSPGNSIDTLDLGANLSFIAGGSFVAEIDSTAAFAVASDLLNIGGNLNIAAGALLSLSDIAGTSQLLLNGTKFTLMSYAGAWDGGTFDLVADDSTITVGLNQFVFDYNDTTPGLNFLGDTPLGVSYVTISAIPEPSAFLFGGLVSGLIGAVYCRRKFKARRVSV